MPGSAAAASRARPGGGGGVMKEDPTQSIRSVLKEERSFAPPSSFSARAHVRSAAEYQALYRRAAGSPEAFWADVAGDLWWQRRFSEVRRGDFGAGETVEWFVGGELNASVYCLDRHLGTWRRNKAA